MRSLITALIFLLTFNLTAQRQEIAKMYLQEAKKALNNYDHEDFIYNLGLFSDFLSSEKITPETISEELREQYSTLLYNAVVQLTDGSFGLDNEDEEESFKIPQEIAEIAFAFLNYQIEGRPNNMYFLAYLYLRGEGVAKDQSLAIYWYEKAAEKGQIEAMQNLGTIYHQGIGGIPEDYTKAKYWYEKAANGGQIEAMFNLGTMYHKGEGVEQDYAMAIYWFEKAANAGYHVAMFNLSVMYQGGKGVEQDLAQAADWAEKAAAKGNLAAMYNLGVLYGNGGPGFDKDYQESKYWFQKACASGLKQACYVLQKL